MSRRNRNDNYDDESDIVDYDEDTEKIPAFQVVDTDEKKRIIFMMNFPSNIILLRNLQGLANKKLQSRWKFFRKDHLFHNMYYIIIVCGYLIWIESYQISNIVWKYKQNSEI